jgi:hypothetical protein
VIQPDDSTVANAIFATWFDCNWERHNSLVDAYQSGDHKRLASLLDTRQRALQSRAKERVPELPPHPQPKRQRKPSIKRMIAAAERAGKKVTSITTPDGVTLRFDESEPTKASNPWLAGIDDKVTKQ